MLMFIAAIAGFLFIHSGATFTIFAILTFVSVAVFQGSTGALGPRLLPREQYGQFCSANSMLWHFGLMAALPLAGGMMDSLGNRFIFVWFFCFSAIGIGLMYLVYLDWKKLGGDAAYRPPKFSDFS